MMEDKVSHKSIIMIHKLSACNFGPKTWKWVGDFLNSRKQRVIVVGSCSEWYPVTSGIPERSVLWPNWLVLFIKVVFADGTKIYRWIDSQTDTDRIHSDLHCLSNDSILKLATQVSSWQMQFYNYQQIAEKMYEKRNTQGIMVDQNQNWKL